MPFSEHRASNHTPIAAAQTDSVIAGGGSITVYGILCSNTNTSAETVTIEEADGTTLITIIRVPANSTIESSVEWLADRGVAVTTPTTTTCLVFHSNSGS